jgi:histidinol dehydrogenase
MKRYINPDRGQWETLTERTMTDDAVIEQRVAGIISRVRENGDKALIELAAEIDSVDLSAGIEVTAEEISLASQVVSEELKKAVADAYANIYAFHSAQKFDSVDMQTAPGVRCVQKPMPIQRVGLYIPGGSAPLFSTVLMLAVPAKVAGCPEVILCTPCGKDGKVAPAVLYAASYCGVDRIFKVGGAQAVAAMAYGTETVPCVHKIVGPGNRYVTKA